MKKLSMFFVLALAAVCSAQVSFTIDKPRLIGIDQAGLSGIYSVSYQYSRYGLDAGLAHYHQAGFPANNMLINPKFSYIVGNEKTKLTYYAYLPFVGSTNIARIYGALAQPENLPAFINDAIILGATVSRWFDVRNDIRATVEIGATPMLAYHKYALTDWAEVLIPFNFNVTDYSGKFFSGVELGGNYYATQSNLSFGDNLRAQLKFTFGYRYKNLAAALYFKLPIDHTTEAFVRDALGIMVAWR